MILMVTFGLFHFEGKLQIEAKWPFFGDWNSKER